MIKLFDDWVILVNPYDYCLARYRGQTKRKDGGTDFNYDRIGFYSSPEGCLKRLGEELTREALKDRSVTLSEAVAVIRESNAKVEKLLKEVMQNGN